MRTAILIGAALAAMAPLEATGASAACLPVPPSEKRDAIRSGQVMRPGALTRRVNGEIVGLDLCREGANLRWRVTVLEHSGTVKSLLLDARSGAQK